MERAGEPRDQTSALDTVRALIDAALTVVTDLTRKVDPLVTRVIQLFDRMPPEDRDPILDILEREVEMRVMSRRQDERVVGLEVGKPDPNPRLYVRIWEPARMFQSNEDMLRAVLRGIQLVLQSPGRAVQEGFERAMAEAFRLLDARERGALLHHLRQWVAVVERLDADVSAKAS
jgi:hypothetical protein